MEEESALVYVLLATQNGALFLDSQLQSLADQKNVRVKVIANDDGSTDDTLQILKKWQKLGLVETVIFSDRIGPTKVFFKLLELSGEFKYVAMCDQDDVWDENKLWRQIREINDLEPMIVSCSRQFIDEFDNLISDFKSLRKPPSFRNAMVENITPGNTLLMNNRAIKLVNSFPTEKVVHYDAWIYLLVSGFGCVKYVNEPLIKYRLHAGNHVGLGKRNIKSALNSIKEYLINLEELRMAIENNNSPKKMPDLERFLMMKNTSKRRIKLIHILKIPIERQRIIDSLFFRFLLLFLLIEK
jgi:glycosyltransferase involved in cell wall biosynthesis